MSQLILEFDSQTTTPKYPDFNDFLGDSNRELIHILQHQQERFIYVWGATGVGKSHLLKAWVAQALEQGEAAAYVDASKEPLGDHLRENRFLAVDAVEALSGHEQVTLFSIFNQFRDLSGGHLLISGDVAPAFLNIREDLRTRMGYCLVYEVKALTDLEKINSLREMAKARQLVIGDELFRYLLTHWRRDMDSLMQIVEALDHYSMALHKPITLPLLKKLLNQEHTET
ncbi:DnaA regulatory inactivator Hda [Neisseriaceae bacterium CLB008]|nr:DnaA regulatory inactivator Hda [Neisseriaceae bacterium]